MSLWEQFVRQRLNELHHEAFGPCPRLFVLLAWFEYHRLLNLMGYGIDYSDHPRNPFK